MSGEAWRFDLITKTREQGREMSCVIAVSRAEMEVYAAQLRLETAKHMLQVQRDCMGILGIDTIRRSTAGGTDTP